VGLVIRAHREPALARKLDVPCKTPVALNVLPLTNREKNVCIGINLKMTYPRLKLIRHKNLNLKLF